MLLVFDVTREQSFQNAITNWYEIIKNKAETAVVILVGKKKDLEKRVEEDKINEWCKKNKVKYVPTSVKLNSNV